MTATDLAKHGSHDQKDHGRRGAGDHPAIQRLTDGKAVIVQPRDVADVVSAFEGYPDGPVDLTNLHVAGMGLFGGDGLEIARIDMPQIPKTHRDKFFAELEADGVTVKAERVDPTRMKPTQREMDAVNIAGMAKGMRGGTFKEGKHTLIASSDGYILDGHHRWAAAVVDRIRTGAGDMGIARVDMPIRQLLDRARDFNEREGIKTRALGDHTAAVRKELDGFYAAMAKHGSHDQKSHGRRGGTKSGPKVDQFTDEKGNLVKPIGMRDSDFPDEEIHYIPEPANPLGEDHVVALWKGGSLAGQMRLDPESGEVLWISVQPEHRRKGIATRMWEAGKLIAAQYPVKPPMHSDIQTADGKRWARTTKAVTVAFEPGLVPVLKHGSHNQKDHGRRYPGSVDPAVAAKAIRLVGENGGLSIRLTDGAEPDSGYMVARDSKRFGIAVTADEFYGPDGAKHIADMVKKNRTELGSGRAYLGVWHQTSKTVDGVEIPLPRSEQVVHLDVTDNIPSRDRAVNLGRRRDQISVWDVANFEEIQTGGAGAEVAKGTDGVRDPEAGGRDDGRRDRRVGGEGPRRDGEVRPAVVAFEPGLVPVLKHAQHNQKDHGRRGTGDLPDGWTRRDDEDRVQEIMARARGDWGGAIPEDRLRAFAEADIPLIDEYTGPNGTRLRVHTGHDIPAEDIHRQMGYISALQKITPVEGLEVVVSDGPFEALGLPLGTAGFNEQGTTRIHLRARAVTTGKVDKTGALMPVFGTDPTAYPLVHEYGHVIDRRSAQQSSDDKGIVIAQHQRGMSRYAFADEDPRAVGREAFAEAWTGWVGTRGQSTDPFVRYFADKYGWDAGDATRPPSAPIAKSRLILGDSFDESGATVIEIDDDVVLKHGSHDQRSHGRRGGGSVPRITGTGGSMSSPDYDRVGPVREGPKRRARSRTAAEEGQHREQRTADYLAGRTAFHPTWSLADGRVVIPRVTLSQRVAEVRFRIEGWIAKKRHDKEWDLTPDEVDRISRENRRRVDERRAAQGKPPIYDDVEKATGDVLPILRRLYDGLLDEQTWSAVEAGRAEWLVDLLVSMTAAEPVAKHLPGQHDQSTHGRGGNHGLPTEQQIAQARAEGTSMHLPYPVPPELKGTWDKATDPDASAIENDKAMKSLLLRGTAYAAQNGLSLDPDESEYIEDSAAELYGKALMRRRMDATMQEKAWDDAPESERVAVHRYLSEVRETGQVAIAARQDAVEDILDDERFRSQFDANDSNGAYDPTMRAMLETAAFDHHPDVLPEHRPIYGYVVPAGTGVVSGGVSQYGDARFVLREATVDRTTVTVGDSLNTHATPVPMTGPMTQREAHAAVSRTIFGDDGQKLVRSGPERFVDWHYFEAQIHGGVTLDDVAEVHLPLSMTDLVGRRRDAEQRDYIEGRFKVFGIPVRWYDDGVYQD